MNVLKRGIVADSWSTSRGVRSSVSPCSFAGGTIICPKTHLALVALDDALQDVKLGLNLSSRVERDALEQADLAGRTGLVSLSPSEHICKLDAVASFCLGVDE